MSARLRLRMCCSTGARSHWALIHSLSGVRRIQPRDCALTLPDGLAGVHAVTRTLVPNDDELVLIDHSNYGTFVNGERVSERVHITRATRCASESRAWSCH